MNKLILSTISLTCLALGSGAYGNEKQFDESSLQLLTVTSNCLGEFGQAMKEANGIKSAVRSGSFAESTYTLITQHESTRGIASISIPRAKLEIVQKWDKAFRTFRYSCKVSPFEQEE